MGVDTARGADGSEIPILPIAVESLDYRAHDMDFYIRHDSAAAVALYRGAGTEFTADDAKRLAEQGIKFLFIPVKQHARYCAALTAKLDRQFGNTEVARAERGRVIRAACGKMIEDVMLLPGRAEPIAAVREMASQFTRWAAADGDGFSYLLDMSAHDFHTTSHMVNVGVGCGMLMAELRPGDSAAMSLLHQGGLLHDVGKRGVPEAILNKEGKLDPEEWEAIKRHPSLGHEELKSIPGLPPEVLDMTLNHHERLDGKGYPRGLKAEDLSLPARVCAVVDVFDAMTAARPYRGPLPPLRVLEMMAEGKGTQFDEAVLATWTRLVTRMIEADPQRAASDTGPGVALSLDLMLPSDGGSSELPAGVPGAGTVWEDRDAAPATTGDRRREDRIPCDIPITGAFIQQLKRHTVRAGQPFAMRMLDVSRGGMLIATPWPLAVGEVLSLQIPSPRGQRECRGRVVRVRKNTRHQWVAGIMLLETAGAAKPTAPLPLSSPVPGAPQAPTTAPAPATTGAPAAPAVRPGEAA